MAFDVADVFAVIRDRFLQISATVEIESQIHATNSSRNAANGEDPVDQRMIAHTF